MIWNSTKLNDVIRYPHETRPLAIKLIQNVWRFSQFYGEYQSRPPAERRKFAAGQAQKLNHCS
jgi:hypothetical protein